MYSNGGGGEALNSEDEDSDGGYVGAEPTEEEFLEIKEQEGQGQERALRLPSSGTKRSRGLHEQPFTPDLSDPYEKPCPPLRDVSELSALGIEDGPLGRGIFRDGQQQWDTGTGTGTGSTTSHLLDSLCYRCSEGGTPTKRSRVETDTPTTVTCYHGGDCDGDCEARKGEGDFRPVLVTPMPVAQRTSPVKLLTVPLALPLALPPQTEAQLQNERFVSLAATERALRQLGFDTYFRPFEEPFLRELESRMSGNGA